MTTEVTSASLEGLQTLEQRRILDTITEVHKQGLGGVLSLPQICRLWQPVSGQELGARGPWRDLVHSQWQLVYPLWH